MKLRPRLVLTTLAAGVPALVALWAVGNSMRDEQDDAVLRALVLAHFSPAQLDGCEAAPPRTPIDIPLPSPKPGTPGDAAALRVFTYALAGHSSQPDAPALPSSLLAEVRELASAIGQSIELTTEGRRYLLVALPRAGGPCALALIPAQRLGPPGPPPHELFVPLALALGAGLVGIWPVVRRIRAMTLAVRGWTEGTSRVLSRDAQRDELSELSRALTESAETIQRQHAALVTREKALLEFIENTTHDLATPLTVLQGNLSALAKGHSAEAVRQAMQEAQYIGALLGNLAVSAKFETGAQVEAVLDLRDVVSRVVARHRAMATWLGLHFEHYVPEEPVPALGDPTFTERALANLVENAMRHNARGGHVAIVLETEGPEFALRVLDDGPGLTRDACEAALRRAEAPDAARSREASGSGLGLSIVARVAQRQAWRFSLMPGTPEGLIAELRGPVA